MPGKCFKDLIVWQKSMDVVQMIYGSVEQMPKEEMFSLTNQMKRSAVSIPSNIAEGQSRGSTKEFIQFLSIAQGSKAELETQLIICKRLGYLDNDDVKKILSELSEIGRMLSALISHLKK